MSGVEGDISGVTAGIGISGGGTSGTVTVTNSMATAIDAKGDLVVGTGADTFSKLTVGANATFLVADSAQATGLKYQAPTVNTVIDAKGDLLVGTASDTVSRLAVGADYSYLQALASAGTGTQWGDAWTSYTPTWTSTGTAPALGNGTLNGSYIRVGKLCTFKLYFSRGSTSTNGTGNYTFTFPFTSSMAGGTACGTFYLEDSGVAGYVGVITLGTPTTFGLRIPTNTEVGATSPFTWGTGDFAVLTGTFEVA